MEQPEPAATAPSRRLLAADAAAAAVIAALVLGGGHAPLPQTAAALLAAGSIALRRYAPATTLAVAVGALAVTAYDHPGLAVWLAVLLNAYTAAARPLRASALGFLTTVAGVWGGVLCHILAFRLHLSPWVWTAASLQLGVVWTIGWSRHREHALHEARRQHAEQRVLAAEAEARRTVAEERLRLARELHDIVGHSLSVIAVQSGTARHVLAEQPEEAAKALDAIRATSRTALTELRSLLGVLREDAPGEPGPGGLADLPRLLADSHRAGLHVELTTTGPARPLPAGVDLAAYRIVQEALTNVVKHSDADRADVALTYRDGELDVEVVDAGRPRSGGGGSGGGGGGGGGHGLVGIRERAALYGGRMAAGPLAPIGYRLTATLRTAAGEGR
ncbi:sensor histidine kinase [Kitasatospora phosalacinea]|uniref:histidine kinase n=1 Tax=Kitasatospora phosalacinea TaxID=2065 RepID=A0ABW6GPP6_9ACTN